MKRSTQALVVLLISLVSFNLSSQTIWEDKEEAAIHQEERAIVPSQYRTLTLDFPILKSTLLAAPSEAQTKAERSTAIITLPLPDGSLQAFRFVESSVMHPVLAAKYSQITTFLGIGVDNPTALIRMDLTPNGFHAVIANNQGMIYIDPYHKIADEHYVSYHKKDFTALETHLAEICQVVDSNPPSNDWRVGPNNPNGEELAIYRLALAATGEYTAYNGGTVLGAIAAMVSGLNRINLIFERDLAIRLTLIANNDLLVYTDPATDPYSNGNSSTMIIENHNNITATIGVANFDVGHLLATAGGGLAQQQGPCRTTIKGMGVTATSPPNNDPYYIDFVAHQLGHQFGASHTFNGTSGSCNGNRNSSTAYEPGSGTTIMGYAGICGAHNIQNNSGAYFSKTSFDQIIAYSRYNAGYACAAKFSTTNVVPIADAGASGFYIPKETPFTLTGSAIDPDVAANLTYCWEQNNLGPAGDPNAPVGSAPIFRSFVPSSSASRTFPRISDLVNNTQTFGELLPSYARTLDFCLTVRDNQSSGGGVDWDCISFDVVDDGPFEVLYPNNNEIWSSGFVEGVNWAVANTNQAPVNCATVDILLSVDGGQTYTYLLADNVPNDGYEPIIVPAIISNTVRLKIACSDNIFFDISNTNLTIIPTLLDTELLDFSGELKDNAVHLAWTTASEENTRGFEVEARQKNGQFENYGFVSSKGNTENGHSYDFNTPRLSSGVYYFRLKILDQDGSHFYSELIAVDVPETDYRFMLYPNPAKDVLNIELKTENLDGALLSIYNASGHISYQERIRSLDNGWHLLTFDLSRLSPGIYFYQLLDNNQLLEESGRLTIE